MASYCVLEEHTTLDPDFSILAFAFCWACGLSWNKAWANAKSSLLDIPMSVTSLNSLFPILMGTCQKKKKKNRDSDAFLTS
jgi:hypothetical protein